MFIVAGFAALSACAAPTTPEERVAEFRALCLSYGFEEGSDELTHCVYSMDQEYNARRMAAGMMVAGGVSEFGRGMQANYR